MSDEPFYSWRAKPQAPPLPIGAERVWLLVKDGRRLSCELRDHAEQVGVEVQLFVNEDFRAGYRHPSRVSAQTWATEYRQEREADGWRTITSYQG
jgi:hypothetical protein